MVHKLSIELDRPIFKKLKESAEEDGVSPTEYAEGIIEDHFDEENE